MSEYSIKSTVRYVNYNMRDALIATYSLGVVVHY